MQPKFGACGRARCNTLPSCTQTPRRAKDFDRRLVEEASISWAIMGLTLTWSFKGTGQICTNSSWDRVEVGLILYSFIQCTNSVQTHTS